MSSYVNVFARVRGQLLGRATKLLNETCRLSSRLADVGVSAAMTCSYRAPPWLSFTRSSKYAYMPMQIEYPKAAANFFEIYISCEYIVVLHFPTLLDRACFSQLKGKFIHLIFNFLPLTMIDEQRSIAPRATSFEFSDRYFAIFENLRVRDVSERSERAMMFWLNFNRE